MVPLHRFTVILDACTMYPMLVRDVLLTFASHEFFNAKWSPRIVREWTTNLDAWLRAKAPSVDSTSQIQKLVSSIHSAFPDAEVGEQIPEAPLLHPVDPKDRHVVMTAIIAQADAIITFNITDFAAAYLRRRLRIEIMHPDDFIMDLVTLHEKQAVAAFRELRARKKNPRWDVSELIRRLNQSGLVQTSAWVSQRATSHRI